MKGLIDWRGLPTAATIILLLLYSIPARAQWVTTYRNASCSQNGVPDLCDVYYNEKEVTWKVLWKGYNGIRYYTMRGGNYFLEKDSAGRSIGVWVLNPSQQTLEKDGEVIKIFELR